MSKSKWKDPKLDQTGRGFPSVNPTKSARPGTGSGNKAPLVKQARDAMGEFDATTKHAQRRQRH
jgi:hypothetical protein